MESELGRAWLDVDLPALVRNARALSERSGKPLLPMVKADAYGLGAVEVCAALEALDPWAFGVATIGEVEELRRAGVRRPILVFSPLLTPDLARAKALGAVPTLGSAGAIEQWRSLGGGTWHLAIDTGMHRAGLEWWRVGDVREVVRGFEPEGAFTHFHSADEDAASVREQEARFRLALGELPARPRILHAENSPRLERHGTSEWDVVRPGVFLYGVGGGPGSQISPEPVAHLRARVVEMHEVRAGEGVSYGATWRAQGQRRVATLAIGYADGYRRAFSSRGVVLLNGTRVPVVGRVTMDMTLVDVTGAKCDVGDTATLIGRSGDHTVDLNVAAREADLLAYELLVGFRLRVPRVYSRAGGPPRFQK